MTGVMGQGMTGTGIVRLTGRPRYLWESTDHAKEILKT